jgi:Ca-activated chloride channel family protein
MKPFLPDDPRWTAYVLNELQADELREAERLLAADPDLKARVEAIHSTSQLLSEAFASEPAAALAPEQRNEIFARAERPQRRSRHPAIPVWFGSIAAAATVWILAFSSYQYILRLGESPVPTLRIRDLGHLEEYPELEAVEAPESTPAEKVSDHSLSELLSDISTPVQLEPLHASMSQPRVTTINGVVVMTHNSVVVMTQPPVISPSLDDFEVLPRSGFQRVGDHPLSTFSIDVDTAAYAVVRKMLNEGRLPPPDAVRVEEMINYFPYNYAAPVDGRPFAAHLEMAACPWQPRHQLLRVALKGREIPAAERPGMNLVFLIDVSGSMEGTNRLPLVKRAMSALVKQLDERDRVAIVVYAGAAGVVLPPTSGDNTPALLAALDNLKAGGSTAGAQGIQLAYDNARQSFDKERVNRVILCTDGDFNVGISSRGELERLIETEAKSGVFLSVLGFGMGNYKDSTLELLSNKGNGNYAYIDDFSEARKVLVDQMLGTLVTIAKDVKVQVEFNPALVVAYRLIGYENRLLKKEDFNNDAVDAGDIGAGHTVTALYEIVPAGVPVPDAAPAVDPLKYQPANERALAADTGELLTVKLRYKEPDGDRSEKLEFPVQPNLLGLKDPSGDFRFAAAVAAFGQALRDPAFAKDFPLDRVLDLAESAVQRDPGGHRAEFLRLVRNAMAISGSETEE